ncbi:F-box/LRR-repeat protein [Acrasis kona]|uniref:F-box/LRR-repeat protein n=1 Tax=Acrasis kona TaxID=1008807 RepID=A0AAW2ZIK9_9EUKA
MLSTIHRANMDITTVIERQPTAQNIQSLKRRRDESPNQLSLILHNSPIVNNNNNTSPSNEMRPTKKLRRINYANKWAWMPREALFVTLQFLTKPELIKIGAVSRHWYTTSRVNVLWSNLHSFTGFKVSSLNDVCEFLETVFKGHAPVLELTLPKNCAALSPYEFRRLSDVCCHLSELNLPVANSETVQSINDECLKELSRVKTLRMVNLSTHQAITDEGLQYFVNQLKDTLTHINIDHCRSISASTVIKTLTTCNRLESFSALFCANAALTKSDLIKLRDVSDSSLRLSSLSIELGEDACEQSGNIQNVLKRYQRSLRSLHLRGWRHIGPVMSDELTNICQQLINLQKLTVSCTSLSEINTAPNTTANIQHQNATVLIESDSIKEILLNRFENLHKPIFKCSQLSKLHLEGMTSLHDVSLETPQLQEFILRSSRIIMATNDSQPQFMHKISTLHSLRIIEVFDCGGLSTLKITPSSNITHLTLFMCNDLESLFIHCDRLTFLNIDACQQLKIANIKCSELSDMKLFSLPQPMQSSSLDELYLYSDQLKNLSLLRCANLTKVQIDCIKLNSINLNECKVLRNVNLNCGDLEKLALGGPHIEWNDRMVRDLNFKCPNINMLSLSHVSIDDQVLESISRWSTLKALVVSNCENLMHVNLRGDALKGVQLMDCNHLKSTSVQSDALQKLIFRNCARLEDPFREMKCANLQHVEAQNCTFLSNVNLRGESVQQVFFNHCPQLNRMMMAVPRISKLKITECAQLESCEFMGPIPHLNLVEISLEKCIKLSDVGLQRLMSMTPNVRTCHIKQCHSLQKPNLKTLAHLQMIDFLECARLNHPVLHDRLRGCTISLKACPSLQFTDFSQIAHFADFVEIVNCESLVNRVGFRLSGIKRLNLALCHRLVQVDLYGAPQGEQSRLEKLLIAHCRQLVNLTVNSNTRPIITQLKDCPKLGAPTLAPPAKIIACMMGCRALGCEGGNIIERTFE